jgi:hypothetical protein
MMHDSLSIFLTTHMTCGSGTRGGEDMASFTPTGAGRDPVAIDSTVPHTSRIYDYLLGGTDNFAVDREVAEHAFSAYPGGMDGVRADARANRAFLGRAVRFLASEAGIRQFLDIGTGIPTADNTHAVAQAAAPTARVVYVDNDPIVLAHAHALLQGSSEGLTAYVDGDFGQPELIMEQAAETLDLRKPVGLVLVGILHVIPDASRPHEVVAYLKDHLVSGCYEALSHMAIDIVRVGVAVGNERLDLSMRTANPPAFRDRAEIERFFTGLTLVEPGLVAVNDWRPDTPTPPQPDGRITPLYGGVARKP